MGSHLQKILHNPCNFVSTLRCQQKNFSNESFPGFPLSFKEKPGMPIIFLTQIQLLLIFFVRSQPNYLKLFCAQKKDLVKYSILMIVFVILKVETKGRNDVQLHFTKIYHLILEIIFLATIIIEFNLTLIHIFNGMQSVLKSQHHGQNIHPTEDFCFNDFVQNSLCCSMNIICFDLRGHGGFQRPKTTPPKSIKELIDWKKMLIKIFQ